MVRLLVQLHAWSHAAREFVRGFAEDIRQPERVRSLSWLRLVRECRPSERTWLIARAVSLKAF